MLPIGFEIFLRIPTETNQRLLVPAKVIAHDEDQHRIQIDRESVPFAESSEVLAYFTPNREFMQQPSIFSNLSIDEINEKEALCASIQLTGEPVSAEGRSCYRASTALSSLTVSFDKRLNTKLLDISLSGLSVEAKPGRKIGERVEIAFVHNKKQYSGAMTLQSIKELDDERTRYGLYIVEERGSKSNLQQGLQQLSMQVQREQLRRQSGAA